MKVLGKGFFVLFFNIFLIIRFEVGSYSLNNEVEERVGEWKFYNKLFIKMNIEFNFLYFDFLKKKNYEINNGFDLKDFINYFVLKFIKEKNIN